MKEQTTKTTVIIETTGNPNINPVVSALKQAAVLNKPAEPKKKKHRPNPNYVVADMDTLVALFSAGLFDKMHGIGNLRTGKVYYFDRCPEVKAVLDKLASKPTASKRADCQSAGPDEFVGAEEQPKTEPEPTPESE